MVIPQTTTTLAAPAMRPVAVPRTRPVTNPTVKPVTNSMIKPGAVMPTMSGEKKPFDIQLYMIAVQTAVKKFFSEQVPYFFKNIGSVMSQVVDWWKKQKQDEQIAYAGWIFGHVLGLVGIILIFIL